MIGIIDLTLCGSFFVFCFWAIFQGRQYVTAAINEYRKTIQEKIQLAQQALDESRDELEKLQQSYASLEAQKNDIVTLAQDEARFIWENAKKTADDHHKEIMEQLEHFRFTGRDNIIRDMKHKILDQVRLCCTRLLNQSDSQEHMQFFLSQGKHLLGYKDAPGL